MKLGITVVVTFLAGMGAGLGTGFAGMSAAAVISPMLITFLGIEPYMAVGIALSSDVLASAVSAYTYGKHKNLDIKNGIIMMASVLIFTVIGREIAVAVKEGGADPANNSKLRDVIAKAKANNMPNDTIDRGIKKAAVDLCTVNYENLTFEGYGPN